MNLLPLRVLDLPRGPTRAVSLIVVVVTAVLALTSLPSTENPAPALVGVGLFTGVLLSTTSARGVVLPMRHTVIAAATPTLLVLLVSWPIIRAGHSMWHLGASAFLLLALALRGRLGAAWLGMLGMLLAALAWGALSHFGAPMIAGIMLRQVAILVIGTIFIVAVGRVRDELDALAASNSRLAAAAAAANAAEHERRARVRWAYGIAAPSLRAIAAERELTDEVRAEAALAEAELRDGLRARTLAGEPVSSAARSARRRGVEVVMLDDRATELPRAAADALRARIAAELDAADAGRVVVRLPPESGAALATVLVDSATPRRLTLTLDDLETTTPPPHRSASGAVDLD